MGRLKLLTKAGELRPPFDDDEYDALGQWISDHIPAVPIDQLCESSPCVQVEGEIADDPPPATTFMWRIEGHHVCFTYICEPCEATYVNDEPVDPAEYPTTEAGYAVSPKHCS